VIIVKILVQEVFNDERRHTEGAKGEVVSMNTATKISKLARRFANLQRDLRKNGLSDIADMMSNAGLALVKRGLDAYDEEYNP